MDETRAYKRAAVMWFISMAIVVWWANRHFSQTTADLITWIPFAMFLRSLWKWWQARKRQQLRPGT
jgi:hypothetical protein